MYATISPFSKSFDDVGFTYKVPKDLKNKIKTGMIVKIPLGKSETYGIVLEIKRTANLNNLKVKEIISLYSNDIFLNDSQIRLLKFISKNYFCLIHSALNLFFPKNLIRKINKSNFFLNNTQETLKYEFHYDRILDKRQYGIFKKIVESDKNAFLIHGTAQSLKIEIYINLIKHYLDLGKQSLLLVPEIILGDQILENLKKVFGENILAINSTISETKKTKYWELIHSGNAKIIIGTRSALFYPYNNLGIIIIDEAHDSSYISDMTPRYDSVEVALEIGKIIGNKVVLCSGTPKITHYYDFLKDTEKEILNLF